VRAVFFDIYGTLLISSRGEVGSDTAVSGPSPEPDTASEPADSGEAGPAVEALRRAGYLPQNGTERRVRELYIESIKESHAADRALGIAHPEVEILSVWEGILRTLAGEGLIDRGPEPYSTVTASLCYELRTNRVWPMPGAAEVLRELSESGAILGVVSNAQFYTPLMIEALFGASLEELGARHQVWSYREREAKPSPRLFHTLFRRLGQSGLEINPGESVYVGNDMLNDMKPALSSGLRTVLFAGDERSLRLRNDDPRVDGCRPDAVCTDLHRLPNIVTL
jgi:putative hydrolase of the HAD superfamily